MSRQESAPCTGHLPPCDTKNLTHQPCIIITRLRSETIRNFDNKYYAETVYMTGSDGFAMQMVFAN